MPPPPSTPSQEPKPTTLHPRPQSIPTSPPTSTKTSNPLPPLLQTPSGLALLELQGTINLPPSFLSPGDPSSSSSSSPTPTIPIGRLHFPDYHPLTTTTSDGTGTGTGNGKADEDTSWTKRVWMYVGEHQRLQGEVKRLPRAVAVLRRRMRTMTTAGTGTGVREQEGGDAVEEDEVGELEVVEIVKWKVVFSSRPEPVGGGDL